MREQTFRVTLDVTIDPEAWAGQTTTAEVAADIPAYVLGQLQGSALAERVAEQMGAAFADGSAHDVIVVQHCPTRVDPRVLGV